MKPANDLQTLWQQDDVNVGLQYTSDLLSNIVGLAAQSPNHSLKAQHLLTRGIEVLASIQQYLVTGTDDFLDAIRTIQSLEVTEGVLVDSITVLNEDVQNAGPAPSDRAVLSSWHLNRNTFSNQLKTLSTVGPTPDEAWTNVMRDVVKADDINWATRLVEDIDLTGDENTKQSLETIISTLDQSEPMPEEAEAEKIQTDSILAIMCLADEVARPSGKSRTEVLTVVHDIAGELKKKEGRNWKSLSDRLHTLPVCRQVEKPLLVHQGSYSIPNIVDDAQAEVDLASAGITALIPFGSTEASLDDSKAGAVKKHLSQVGKAMKDAAGHLKALALKDHESVKGGKDSSAISYSALRLLTNAALAITPASELPTSFGESLGAIVSSVSEFIDALDCFELAPNWKETFTRGLGGTASLLRRFERPDTIKSSIDIASPVTDSFGDQPKGFNVPGGSNTPETTSEKGEKHRTREIMAGVAGAVKDIVRIAK